MDIIASLFPFAIMIGLMYFLLIRPQKKQQEKVKDMLDSVEVGDSVVTIGGLHGIIDEIKDAEQTIVLDCEGIYLTFERRSVARVVSETAEGIVDTEAIDVEESDTEFDNTEE